MRQLDAADEGSEGRGVEGSLCTTEGDAFHVDARSDYSHVHWISAGTVSVSSSAQFGGRRLKLSPSMVVGMSLDVAYIRLAEQLGGRTNGFSVQVMLRATESNFPASLRQPSSGVSGKIAKEDEPKGICATLILRSSHETMPFISRPLEL
jgi:hypothetical protein